MKGTNVRMSQDEATKEMKAVSCLKSCLGGDPNWNIASLEIIQSNWNPWTREAVECAYAEVGGSMR